MKNKNFIIVLCFLIFALISSGGCGGSSSSKSRIERLVQDMTLEAKIGQMFIIRPEHLNSAMSADAIHRTITSCDIELNDVMIETLNKYPAGGFAFFTRNLQSPEQLKKFTDDLMDASVTIPFIAVDEEGGRVARIGNHGSFDVPKIPPMQEIGTSGDTSLAYAAGSIIGGYLSDYGFNLDFAPVADVNINPDNIVIGDRSFGSDPHLVSEMDSAFLSGLHSRGILGTLKHFPGHGDTTSDTHTGYVAIYKTWDELLQAELIPFIENFNNTDMVMIEHITLINITSDDLPASMSYQLITERLRNELNYDGVVITDSMEMGAINNAYPSGEATLKSIEAGVDIVLLPYDYRESFNAVLNAVKSGRISEQRINKSVERIIELKIKIFNNY